MFTLTFWLICGILKSMYFFTKITLLAALWLCWPQPALAWNEDYTLSAPRDREACIKNLNNIWKNSSVDIRFISQSETCSPEEIRYRWVYGKEPKGSVALLPKKNLENTYPPLVSSWPSNENSGGPRLWHFSCLGTVAKELLGTSMQGYTFKGEITAPAKYQSCEAAFTMAQGVCVNQLGGSELYEQCSGGSNYWLDAP